MDSNTKYTPASKLTLWAGRIMSALVILTMLMSGVMKLLKSKPVLDGFTKLGFSEKHILIIAVLELVATILYLIPRTATLGAILLTGYLGGAIATNLRIGEPYIPPAIIGVMVWGGLFLRDLRIRGLIPLQGTGS